MIDWAKVTTGGVRPFLTPIRQFEGHDVGFVPYSVAARDAPPAVKLSSEFLCDNYPTDDQAIQAAIDALPAGGGTVPLSEGTFVIAATITPRNDLTLLGAGLGATRLVSSVDNLRFFLWEEWPNLLWRVCLSDFTMDGDNRTGQFAIDFRAAQGCMFPRLRVINMPGQTVNGVVTLREYTGAQGAGSCRNHIGSLYLENVGCGLLFRGFSSDYLCEENVVDAIFIDNATVWGVSLNYTKYTRIGYCGVRLGANSAVGFYFNKDNINTGSVEGNSVGYLFVDSTGYATCVGVHFSASRQNTIGMLAHLPDIFNGTLVVPLLAESYNIMSAQPDGPGGTNQGLTSYQKQSDTNNGVRISSVSKTIDHASLVDGGDATAWGMITGEPSTGDSVIPVGSIILAVKCEFAEAFNSDETTTLTLMIGEFADRDAYNLTVDPGEDIYNSTTTLFWKGEDCQIPIATAGGVYVTFTEDDDGTDIISGTNAQGIVTVTIAFMTVARSAL